jgi:AcrR family transcriptional regulator
MATALKIDLRARKTPVQERAAVTVEAVNEATVQVLLTAGLERMTTTRVAARAGVSVGTLYQYYPNKQALLFAVLEQHLMVLATAVEQACEQARGLTVRGMTEALVRAFIDAKMRNTEVSMSLYAAAAAVDSAALVQRMSRRCQKAVTTMLTTAPDGRFEELDFKVMMLFATMAGTTRMVLEAGASAKMVRMLRAELLAMCLAYLGA